MKALILGAGALGSLMGALLSGRNEVTLVGREPHMSAIREHGLRISGQTEAVARPETLETIEDVSGYDFIFLTVKSYDTRSAMETLSGLRESGPVVTMQNGLGNLEIIGEYSDSVIGGTTSHGATFEGPGIVTHAGKGDTVVGAHKGVSRTHLESIAGELTACGMRTAVTENLSGEVWAKAIVNAGINPLTAILKARNGYLLRSTPIAGMLEDICLEAIAVASACDVQLPEDDLVDRTRRVARMTASNKSSMLQDVLRGRITEIDSITGEFVRRGSEAEVPTPLNSAMLALVKGIESSYSI